MTKENNLKLLEEKLNQAVDQFGDTLLESQKSTYQSKLESFEHFKERQKQEIHKDIDNVMHLYQRAFQTIMDHLIGVSADSLKLTSEEKEHIFNDIKRGQQNLLQVIDSDNLVELVEDGKTFQEIMGYSNTTLETFYAMGIVCIEKNHWESGLSIFALLTLLNPGYHNFWVCLALCQQAKGDFHAALRSYEIAETIEADDPMPYLYSSECYIELKDRSHALESVDKAIEFASKHSEKEFIEIKRLSNEWKAQLLKTA